MRKFLFAITLFLIASAVSGAPLIPTKQGTTWKYDSLDETGGDAAPVQSQIEYRINGTQQFGGKQVLRFETVVAGAVTKTQLIAVDQNGIRSFAHSSKDGTMIGFISPQVVVPAKLKKGMTWDCVEEIADVRVHEHFTVADAEKVSVPAGDFETFRLHCEESAPMSVTIDRWFASGIGMIKEVSTLRSPAGDLLRRRTLVLTKSPVGVVSVLRPVIKKLLVSVSNQRIGGADVNEFSNATQNIYARWVGHDLRVGAKVRAVWVAENIGDIAPPNYKIDEASAVVTAPDANGVFTLSQPEGGWAPGSYRVEFYLDEALIDTVKLQIK